MANGTKEDSGKLNSGEQTLHSPVSCVESMQLTALIINKSLIVRTGLRPRIISNQIKLNGLLGVGQLVIRILCWVIKMHCWV